VSPRFAKKSGFDQVQSQLQNGIEAPEHVQDEHCDHDQVVAPAEGVVEPKAEDDAND
jgi:hypothetical protein